MNAEALNLAEVPLSCGIWVLVAPISPYVRARLQAIAAAEFPDPDPRPFQKRIEPAAVEMWTRAEDNPEYRQLKGMAEYKRSIRTRQLMIGAGCVVDTTAGKHQTLAQYADALAKVRSTLNLSGNRDDFQDLVSLVLIRTSGDIDAVGRAAEDELTPDEIRRGIATLNIRYNGADLLKVMDERLHPALVDDGKRPKIFSDPSYDRLATAKQFGFEAYGRASRDWRIMMTSYVIASEVVDALKQWDSFHKDE